MSTPMSPTSRTALSTANYICLTSFLRVPHSSLFTQSPPPLFVLSRVVPRCHPPSSSVVFSRSASPLTPPASRASRVSSSAAQHRSPLPQHALPRGVSAASLSFLRVHFEIGLLAESLGIHTKKAQHLCAARAAPGEKENE